MNLRFPDESPLEIDIEGVARQINEQVPMVLIDCRRQDEFDLVHIPGAVHIPMDQLPVRLGELGNDRDQRLVIYCHHGSRSLMVVRWLRQQGWRHAQSMSGGIDRWAEQVDTQMVRY